jgi:hypothetical protein
MTGCHSPPSPNSSRTDEAPGVVWVGAVATIPKSLGRALTVNSGKWDEKATPVKSKEDTIDDAGMSVKTPGNGEGPDSWTCCPDGCVATKSSGALPVTGVGLSE